MINATRELYKRVLGSIRPDDKAVADTIAAASDLKALLDHPGYKLLQKFINTQRQGTVEYMQKEAMPINLFSLPWLFNTFVKYLATMLENRAYNRIDAYIRVTIQRGEKFAEKLAKEEARKAQQPQDATTAGQ